MPKMGESVQEATILNWFKKVGDIIEEDDILLEIATDKVDSEIPSPVDGIIEKIFFEKDALVPVGEVIAVINMDIDSFNESDNNDKDVEPEKQLKNNISTENIIETKDVENKIETRFYSPLVKSIAKVENISISELEQLDGSGANGRVRKQDILTYIESRNKHEVDKSQTVLETKPQQPQVKISEKEQIIEMDRMRRLIADHMVMSKQVSPHVSNFIEVDVTSLVHWREKVKDAFLQQEKTKLTFMPFFVEAVAQAIKEFPGVNVSVDGYRIILKSNINIGMAVALPDGNLIVPVIKNADKKNISGLAFDINNLADAARNNRLSPDDIQDGTFTISNFGTFKNMTGTPIINQPQVAILATGNIEKKPAVIETEMGDMIAIRHKMILSLSYDHRVVDGALGGAFLYRIKELLENFDINRKI